MQGLGGVFLRLCRCYQQNRKTRQNSSADATNMGGFTHEPYVGEAERSENMVAGFVGVSKLGWNDRFYIRFDVIDADSFGMMVGWQLLFGRGSPVRDRRGGTGYRMSNKE